MNFEIFIFEIFFWDFLLSSVYAGIIFILKIRFKGIFRRFKTLLYLGWYNLSPQ